MHVARYEDGRSFAYMTCPYLLGAKEPTTFSKTVYELPHKLREQDGQVRRCVNI